MTQSVLLPSGIDAAFVPTLWNVANALDSDPINLAESLYMESSIEPAVQNSAGYSGINQMSAANLQSMGITPAAYVKLPASVQLEKYVYPFWRSIKASHGITGPLSARDIEWLNFLPATYVANAPDSHVVTSNPAYVTPNKSFDHGNKGYITAGDIGTSVKNAATGARWLAIQAAILAGNPNAGVIGVTGGVVCGILLFLAYRLLGGRV